MLDAVLERLGARIRLCGAACNIALVLGAVSCRIYRDDEGAGAPSGAGGLAVDVVVESPTQKPPRPSEPEEQAPPAEALSLWVLNRPETELVARGSEPPAKPTGEGVPTPPALALVVLGLGPGHTCAEIFARRALSYATGAPDPLRGVTALLDELRRWRWPEASALHAALKTSDGRFGAVQSAPAEAFSSSLLDEAWRREVVLDGRSPRWRKGIATPLSEGPLSPEAAGPSCDSPPGAGLRGPAGVLLRSQGGKYFAGIVDLESPGDAGVITGVTQYGVSVAAGASGGVLLLSDCPTLSDESLAERVYARLPEVAPLTSVAGASCQMNHALITPRGARVTGTGALAWASATDQEWVTAGPSPPDAGVLPEKSEGAQ